LLFKKIFAVFGSEVIDISLNSVLLVVVTVVAEARAFIVAFNIVVSTKLISHAGYIAVEILLVSIR
jgi:hypothetical protein